VCWRVLLGLICLGGSSGYAQETRSGFNAIDWTFLSPDWSGVCPRIPDVDRVEFMLSGNYFNGNCPISAPHRAVLPNCLKDTHRTCDSALACCALRTGIADICAARFGDGRHDLHCGCALAIICKEITESTGFGAMEDCCEFKTAGAQVREWYTQRSPLEERFENPSCGCNRMTLIGAGRWNAIAPGDRNGAALLNGDGEDMLNLFDLDNGLTSQDNYELPHLRHRLKFMPLDVLTLKWSFYY
jgi:hypothetical protein